MPKTSTTVLTARFELNPDALIGLQVKTLSFPYLDAIHHYRNSVERVVNDYDKQSREKAHITADFRQLNNALLACLPTLTHAFEVYGRCNDEQDARQRRALIVETSNTPFLPPSRVQVFILLKLWVTDWIRRTEERYIAAFSQIGVFGNELRSVFELPPIGWDWDPIKESFLYDTDAADGIGFTAIPSILSTLLHKSCCTITTSKNHEVSICWQKAQGAIGGDRTGLFTISQPFRGEYIDRDDHIREGFFAYRLDFRVQTQAGRYHEIEGKMVLKPWVFVFLSCQRYAHEPLKEANHGRNLSFLVHTKNALIEGYPIDGTWVRIAAQNDGTADNPDYLWKNSLPEHLSNFRAASLPSPNAILGDPSNFAEFAQSWESSKDQYLLVDATGYKYDTGRKKGESHAVQHGYSFRERAGVVSTILQLLNGALKPDSRLAPDQPTPKGVKTPSAMRSHHFYRKDSKSKDAHTRGYEGVAQGIVKATGANLLHLSVFWHDDAMRQAADYFIREALFLDGDMPIPNWLTISNYNFSSDNLQALPKPQKGTKEKFKLAWDNKFLQWYDLAELTRSDSKELPHLGLSEIGKVRQPGVSPIQSIRGPLRAAFSRSNITSQMVQPAQWRKKEESKSPFSDDTENRMRSAVLDLLLRQTGALLGPPSELFQAAGFGIETAQRLNVIAFCRRRCSRDYYRGDIQYVLAVRLRAGGAVEVMLPNEHVWIPYVSAGPAVGRIMFAARRDKFSANWHRQNSRIKLSGLQIANFVHDVLTSIGDQPTIAIIEAEGWRNAGGPDTDGKVWPQLSNRHMLPNRNILDFAHLGEGDKYARNDSRLQGLLGIIRLRCGDEVPQYIPDREEWDSEGDIRALQHLSGFCDWSADPLLHYFSAGKSPETAKIQTNKAIEQLYKQEKSDKPVFGLIGDPSAVRIPYRHPSMIEMVPFFIRPDYDNEKGLKTLCRVPHFLRSSPAWHMGNLDSPFPMHLGDQLIEDQLCILGID